MEREEWKYSRGEWGPSRAETQSVGGGGGGARVRTRVRVGVRVCV